MNFSNGVQMLVRGVSRLAAAGGVFLFSAQYIDHGNGALFVRQKWAGLAGPDPDSPEHRWRYQKIPLDDLGDVDWLFATHLSPVADWLAVGTNRTLRIYQVNSAALLTKIPISDGGDLFTFSDDGKWCAHNSGNLKAEVTLRSLPEGNSEAILRIKDGTPPTKRRASALAFAHESSYLAAALKDSMAAWKGFCLWDLTTFQRVATVEAGSVNVKAIAFGDNDTLLATLNADNTVTIWDAKGLLQGAPK